MGKELDEDESTMTLKDYFDKYGKIVIKDLDYLFHSDGKEIMGGRFKVKDKRML